MISEWIWISLLAAAAAAGLFASSRAHRRGRREAELEAGSLRERADGVEARLREAESRLEEVRRELQAALGEKSALEAGATRIPALEEEVRALRDRAESMSRELLETGRKNASLTAELGEIRAREPQVREALQRELAQFLDEKGKGFSKQNTESLENILGPLRTKLQEFEKKVEDTHKEGRDRHVQLKTQIDLLHKMNENLGQEARSLTTALKGENKTGGNWGEVVLERVLESSGLEKGREYRVQPSFAGEEGTLRPDVVIDLPDSRHLVIDSKLSLVAYERFRSAETREDAEAALDAHVRSVRSHIEELSRKRYQDIHSLNTVDFVFLFLAVEPAFIEASRRDGSLFQEAFRRNIVIVSPSTLLATLRTVASIWKQEYQNRNVREIARQATALYDKFVGFLGDLEKVGKSLAAAQESFGDAKAKLSQGKGNLVSRVENLSKLGAKSGKKAIPALWRDDAEPALEESGEADGAAAGEQDEESPSI